MKPWVSEGSCGWGAGEPWEGGGAAGGHTEVVGEPSTWWRTNRASPGQSFIVWAALAGGAVKGEKADACLRTQLLTCNLGEGLDLA